jgi:hypothetical protein
MFDLENITRQVLLNCDISDARHAGLYSICGLALRLRDLYKWEAGLPPWIEKDSSEILDWIGDKEQRWEKIADTEYSKISIQGRDFDPFDTGQINAILEPRGLFYGAGYARSLKPTFFLARIEDKKTLMQHAVYTLDRELARDLLTIPALSQNGAILVRQDSARMFLWDQMLYIKKSGRPALRFALQRCGLKDHRPEALHPHLATILAAQMETYIHHELGENLDTVFNRKIWREIIAAYPHTTVELLARVVKDLLADTHKHGTLRNMIRKRNAAAMGFYLAFIDGLAKVLFADLVTAFVEFAQSGNWAIMDNAVDGGYQVVKRYAEKMIALYETAKQKNDMQWAKIEIQKQLIDCLDPLPNSATANQPSPP